MTEAQGNQGIPGQPRLWGNGLYVSFAVGDTYQYMGKTVKLVKLINNYCTVQVDSEQRQLIVARRALPEIISGIRVFAADNRNVADCTTERWREPYHTNLHGALTQDALLCLSDPSKPLLDPARYTFPISREDGYHWTMEESSHMFAFLGSDRSHEGIDLDMHDARGKEIHPLTAVEDGIIRWIDTEKSSVNEACLLLESASQPGIYYIYKHLNENRILVSPGQIVVKGEKLSYIWGDNVWGHLHFAVRAYGPAPEYEERYNYIINIFPQMYELWHGDLSPRPRMWTEGHFVFNRNRAGNGNKKHLKAYDDVVGYGWQFDTWNTSGSVERSANGDSGLNAALRKILHAGTTAQVKNPNDYYDFEVSVPDGKYKIKARVGHKENASWQHILFEGVDAGTYKLDVSEFAWTPEKVVDVDDGKLTLRIEIRAAAPAGLSELDFSMQRLSN